MARIKEKKMITYKDLENPEIVEMEGFDSPRELKNVLKRMGWRFHWPRIKAGELKLPLIVFEWIGE